MKKPIYLATATIWLLVLQACGQTTDSAYALMLKGIYKHTVPLLQPEQLFQELQKAGSKPVLIDTRTSVEYKVSHLAGARFVGFEDFDVSQLKDVPKDTPLVVYCSVGARSEQIGEQLQQAGYKNVRNLYGGIFEWVNQGYPIYSKEGKTEKVHAYSSTWGIWLQEGEKVYD